MTPSVPQSNAWYEHFLSISRQASDHAAFEIAYHCLAAAMHCAKDLNDLPLMRGLLQEVERQRQHLDRTAPEHPLSTFSAAARGHESSYRTLEGHIGVLIRLRETERHLHTLKKRKEGESSA